MRLHVLGLPHTRTVDAFSHCAYTAKVRKFIPMMAALDYPITHYGVGEPDVAGAEHIEVITPEQQEALMGYHPLEKVRSKEFVGRSTNVSSAHYKAFNEALGPLLRSRVQKDDIICLPFGHGHQQGIQGLEHLAMETGIGYPSCISGYRIYESYAWMHWHLGKENRHAWISEWVVPNYFDPTDWPLRPEYPRDGQYVLYFGRITKEKGMDVIPHLARQRPDLTFLLCGQGDPTPWLTQPNIVYEPPKIGVERAALFHNARCVLLPTVYTEPFGGVAVEAMMTGTPVITSDYGAFTETVPCRRCRPHTEAEWLAALETVLTKDPRALREHAVSRYSTAVIGKRYHEIFQQIPQMRQTGWHGPQE